MKDKPICETDSYGSKRWYLNGELHRTDGPALEYPDGDKRWYLNGKYHRIDGPAIEFAHGSEEWWVNGLLHRTNGPARKFGDGYTEYWINGKRISLFSRITPNILKNILKKVKTTIV